jgi:hypothetical protein
MSKVKASAIQTVRSNDLSFAEKDILRATLRVERHKRNYDIAVEQMTGISKWLNASLFAVNSGGILTVLNNSNNLNDIKTPCLLFIVGLFGCLFSAVANQEFYNRISEPLAEMISYWSEVSITGEEDSDLHDGIKAKMTKITKSAWVGPIFGWLSGLLFLAGAIAIAANMK